MPRFLASVLTPEGASRRTYVEAGNIATATTMLEEQGYRAITIHTSAEELEFEQLNSPGVRDQQRQLTPSQAVRARTDGLGLILQRNWGSLTLAAALMAWGALSGSTWAGWSGLLLLLACLFVIIPVKLYVELTRARNWAEWGRVTTLARMLRFFTFLIHGVGMKFDLDVARATALAGLGRMDEALAITDRWRDHARITPRMFHGRVASVFMAAKRFDDAVESARRALQASPESSESRLDVALQLLQFSDRREEVRELIDPLADLPLAELHRAILRFCQGSLAMERGEHDVALVLLTEAKRQLEPSKWATEPFLALADAYIALAYAGKGEAALARQHVALALPLLTANAHPLCRRLAGL